MRGKDELAGILHRINGRGYKAYQDIEGEYDFGLFRLFIDHVQGDPFASPSRLRARVDQRKAGFPPELYRTKTRRVALEDFLARRFAAAIRQVARGHRGTGKSGLLAIDAGRQQILERTALVVDGEKVEARFVAGLPAAGRSVLGREAEQMLLAEIPAVVERSLLYESIDKHRAREQVLLMEDQEAIRSRLRELRLVAFVANGAVLPRRSGVSDEPMEGHGVVAFQSPPSLEVSILTPNRGKVKGMGIPEGVTLIVGGGYHGKSTLLRALERGVYNHIPGDGRELVITRPDAVKIRAEDGRRVEGVDISPFINNLPHQRDTSRFSTEGASGSTSQAANIMEALEVGAGVLLLDEDTSATNFMIRDRRMQELVAREKEPITPFLDKVRQLYEDLGVSTVMVVGGSGDYFDVADTVIMMEEYRPRDVTARAREIAATYRAGRRCEGGEFFGKVRSRVPLPDGFDPTRGRRTRIAARGLDAIQFGLENIDLSYVEQLVDDSQTRAIGALIHYGARRYFDGRRTLREAIELIMRDLEEKGLEVISPFPGQHPGDYARPRPFELAAAINRLRTLRVR